MHCTIIQLRVGSILQEPELIRTIKNSRLTLLQEAAQEHADWTFANLKTLRVWFNQDPPEHRLWEMTKWKCQTRAFDPQNSNTTIIKTLKKGKTMVASVSTPSSAPTFQGINALPLSVVWAPDQGSTLIMSFLVYFSPPFTIRKRADSVAAYAGPVHCHPSRLLHWLPFSSARKVWNLV